MQDNQVIPPGTDPPAPVTPPVVDPAPAPPPPAPEPPAAEPTPEEAAAQAEDEEWDKATEELFPGIKVAKKEGSKKDEPAKPEKTAEEIAAEEEAAKNKKPDESKGDGDDADSKDKKDGGDGADPDKTDDDGTEEVGTPDTSIRDTRVAAKEFAAQVEVVAADVREKMFKDEPTVLQDASGDPIRSIEDVMLLVNPRTGEAFTDDEAASWLLSAQQQFNQNLEDTKKRITEIAEVNVDLKDEVESITYRYGELLKSMPEVRDQLWAEFEKTLITDKDSGVVTKMPVSLEKFYSIALAPYAKLAEGLENTEDAKKVQEEKDAEDAKKKADEAEAKKKKLADRGDLYGGGKDDIRDEDDKEWDAAIKNVFPQLNKK